MARTFKDSIEADLENVFLNTNEFAVLVSITRSGRMTSNVPAIMSGIDNDSLDRTFATTAVRMVDFDIQTTAYQIDGLAVEPKNGDIITHSDGSRYQVTPFADKQCFEPTGGGGSLLRIHTNRISRG